MKKLTSPTVGMHHRESPIISCSNCKDILIIMKMELNPIRLYVHFKNRHKCHKAIW